MISLRRKLTWSLLLGFTILLGLGGALIYLAARRELYHEFDARLMVKLQALAALTKPGRDKVEFEFPQKLRPLEGASNLIAYYQLFDADGRALVRSPALGQADLPRRFGTLAQPAVWNLTLPDGTPGRAMSARFVARVPPKEKKPPPPDEPPKAVEKPEKKEKEPKPPPDPVEVELVLADDRSHLDDMLAALGALLLSAGGLTLGASALLIAGVLRHCMIPLRRLAERAETIDATSLQARFPTEGLPVELRPIVDRLNDLLGRLQQSFERERRFSADLAHELRTPLAGLRTTAEVALKFSKPADPEPLQAVLEISRQMEAMVNRLLALARAEHRALPLQLEPVRLAPLLEELWTPLRAQAEAKELAVRFEVPADATVEADPTLLRGILGNLLANAVEHTPAAGRVRCAFGADDGRFVLALRNTVAGLDPADLPRLFERFWRKDPARSGGEHLGLGLPLARALAELLGWDLRAELDGPAELTFRLSGPRQRAR